MVETKHSVTPQNRCTNTEVKSFSFFLNYPGITGYDVLYRKSGKEISKLEKNLTFEYCQTDTTHSLLVLKIKEKRKAHTQLGGFDSTVYHTRLILNLPSN